MKKALLWLMALCTVLLCSCVGVGADISENLAPPKPSGELYNIQKALEAYAGPRVNLVYPSSGKYRSAIITEDLDRDESYDAIAFYSTKTDDKTTVMHINYIKNTAGKWKSVTDIQVNCSGVESVEFARLDESAVPKIIVNWSRFSALEKQLSVYSIDSGVLTEITSASFSVYSTCDFNNDGISEIVAVHLDTEKRSAKATLLALKDRVFTAKSECILDGNVTSYYTPRLSKMMNDEMAMFIDADKSTGTVTEVLLLKEGNLVSAFASEGTGENLKTIRASEVLVDDFNGDGRLDIPLAMKLPSIPGSLETDSVYMTTWHSFDGSVMAPLNSALINYHDGYQMVVPEEWKGNFTVKRNVTDRQRVMLRWDSELGEIGEEILRLQAVGIADWEKAKDSFTGYEEITRSDEFVYIVKFSNSALTPTLETVKNNFSVIRSNQWR